MLTVCVHVSILILYLTDLYNRELLMSRHQRVDTDGLFGALKDSPTIDSILNEYESNMDNPTFSDYLTGLLNAKGYTPAYIIQKTCLSKSFTYQILDGTRIPGRDILLRISFVIGLNLQETQRLLMIARRGALYPRVRRDAAVIFCIEKCRTFEQTNELMEEIGETPLL